MPRPTVIVDTGPIVALLDADERHHGWARMQFESLNAPLLTCESVLSEACFLLRRVGADATMPVSLVRRGALRVVDAVGSEERADAVAHLRDFIGPTNSTEAPAGTIRGDFGTDVQCNAVHASDSAANAKSEIAFFFAD